MSDNKLTDSWNEYRKLVIDALERLKDSLEDTSNKLNHLKDTTSTNKLEAVSLLNEEIDRLNNSFRELVEKYKEDGTTHIHRLDLRLNTLETKLYTYTAIISGAVGTLVTLGKTFIEQWMK